MSNASRKPLFAAGRCLAVLRPMLVLVTIWLPRLAAADVVTAWNSVFRQVAQADGSMSNPGWASRTLAMMNGAIYDSLQAVRRTHRPFLVNTTAPHGASFDAAAVQASYRILSLAYPGQSAMLDDARGAALGRIPTGSAKTDGLDLGNAVAEAYVAWRTGDGANTLVQYEPDSRPGHWRPDPLNPTQEAWGPGWGNLSRFALGSATQFAVPPPPDMTSQEYAESFNEVKELGALYSATRTPDQTQMALFWAYDRTNMGPPPVLFNSAVTQIAEQQGNTTEENARLFAMTSVALADAAIASWDAKYAYDLWRPISAIREADNDANPLTEAAPSWVPLGAPGAGLVRDFTPAFPAYISGHATFGEATFRSLAHFYGTDDIRFLLASDELPGIVREFDSFSAASTENARSRIYMGVHFDFDDIQGRILGGQIADWVHAVHFAAVPEPGSLVLAGSCLIGAACHTLLIRSCPRRSLLNGLCLDR